MLDKIRKLREKKGFTLVELIVVIAIIAILTAVIVPLIGRYSAQATYTAHQDTAKSISNSCNTVISDVTMMGSTYAGKVIVGKKNGATLTIEVYDASTTSDAVGSKATDATTADVKTKLSAALADTLVDGDSFFIWVGSNTVKGVEYSKTIDFISTSVSLKAEAVPDFNEAYQDSSKNPIGVSGNYLTTAAGDSTTTTTTTTV